MIWIGIGIGLFIGTGIGVITGCWIISGKVNDILKKESLQ